MIEAVVEPEAHALQAINGAPVRCFESLEAFCESGIEADVASVCTPSGMHPGQCRQLLDSGLHVLCEKPMGLRRADCEQVIHKAMQRQKQVVCVMQNRYTELAQWLKEVIQAQRLGKLYQLNIRCFWNRDQRYYEGSNWKGKAGFDGGPLYTQFSHFVDMLYWVFGDVHDIHGHFADVAHQATTDFEDSGSFHFRLHDHPQAIGSFQYTTAVWDRNMESSLTAIGEKGALEIGGQYMNRLEYCHVEGLEAPHFEEPTANTYAGYQGSAAHHHYVLQNTVDTLRHHAQAMTNALEGMKVVEIIERVYQCEAYQPWRQKLHGLHQ